MASAWELDGHDLTTKLNVCAGKLKVWGGSKFGKAFKELKEKTT